MLHAPLDQLRLSVSHDGARDFEVNGNGNGGGQVRIEWKSGEFGLESCIGVYCTYSCVWTAMLTYQLQGDGIMFAADCEHV